MENDTLDVYGDIDFDLGNEVERLKTENEKLKGQIHCLEENVEKLTSTIINLKETQETLKKNISTLYLTAKAEINRKNRLISELRTPHRRFKPCIRNKRVRENNLSEGNIAKKYKCNNRKVRFVDEPNDKRESNAIEIEDDVLEVDTTKISEYEADKLRRIQFDDNYHEGYRCRRCGNRDSRVGYYKTCDRSGNIKRQTPLKHRKDRKRNGNGEGNRDFSKKADTENIIYINLSDDENNDKLSEDQDLIIISESSSEDELTNAVIQDNAIKCHPVDALIMDDIEGNAMEENININTDASNSASNENKEITEKDLSNALCQDQRLIIEDYEKDVNKKNELFSNINSAIENAAHDKKVVNSPSKSDEEWKRVEIVQKPNINMDTDTGKSEGENINILSDIEVTLPRKQNMVVIEERTKEEIKAGNEPKAQNINVTGRSTVNKNTQNSTPEEPQEARRSTPTPVKGNEPNHNFENIPKKASQFADLKASPLRLTHEVEIPMLHLEKNHINNLPTEDKSLVNPLDATNIFNMEYDIPKVTCDINSGDSQLNDSLTDESKSLILENVISNVTSTPVSGNKCQSEKCDITNSDIR